MKRKLILMMAIFLVLGSMASVVSAEYGKGKSVRMHDEKGMSMEDDFFKQVKTIYSNKEDLGIEEGQLAKIKDVKIALKKDLIREQAELDLVMVDIMAMMYADELDGKVMKDLIDKKYEVKKAKAKRVVDACMSLKDILTEEQKAKMKEMKKGMAGKCPMKEGMMGKGMMKDGMMKHHMPK